MKKILLAIGVLFTLGSIQLVAQCGGFYDGFESGTFTTPWAMGTGTYTNTVPNTGSPVGTYHLSLASSGANSFYQGAVATFAPAQPTYASWYMKTNTTNAANGYVVIGNGNVATDNGIIFCYFNSTSGLRFFNNTGYNHPISANTWYHVEARNINWTARNMDIYINNVLILSGWAFRSTTAMDMDRVHLFSLSAANPEYDEITIGAPPVLATATQTNVACFGGSNGSASVVASGGNGVYTYSWAPSGGTSATASGLAAATYTCTITDGAGCTTTSTVQITEPTAVTATTMQTNVSCNGGSNGDAMVMTSGGTAPYSYFWSPIGATTSSVSGLVGGPYSCTITDANGCSLTESITITQPNALTTASVATDISCFGSNDGTGAITILGGTMPYTVLWSPSGDTGVSVTALGGGTHIYTVTDGNGCTLVDSIFVVEPSLLTVTTSGSTSTCAGSPVTLSSGANGGTGSVSYMWMPGSFTTDSVTVTPSGNTMYYVAVTDSNGCVAMDSLLVTELALPVVSLGVDTSVCGSGLLLDAANAGMMYLWSDSSAAQTLFAGTSGTYGVWVTDTTGCSSYDEINVNVNSNPVIYLGADTAQCGGTVVLDAQIAGATYLWSDNSTAQTNTVSASGTYAVDVIDPNGCSGSDTINVTINSLPVVAGTASANSPCLDDANVALSGSPVGGTWSGPGVAGSQFDPSIGTGPYIATYTYADTNGCSGTSVVTINVNACVGITEQLSGTELNVYPNPNAGSFTLAVNTDVAELFVEITDAQGRVVFTSMDNAVQAGFNRQITLENEAAGMYMMRVVADGVQSVQKISVQK